MEVFLELLLCVCASSSLSIALAFPRRPGPDKQYSNSKRALVRLRARSCMYMPAGWHANTVPPPLHTRPPSSGGGFKKNGRIAGKGSETPGVSGPCP